MIRLSRLETTLLLVILISLSGCGTLSRSRARVVGDRLTLTPASSPLWVSSGFLWDTGSQFSILFDTSFDEVEFKSAGTIRLVDANDNRLRRKLHRIKTLEVDDLSILDGLFIQLEKELLREKVIHEHFPRGVLGMDIIRSSNWLFDLEVGTITRYALEDTVSFAVREDMILNFKNIKHPKTQLNIEGVKLDVLIDTGSTTFLSLRKSDISKLSAKLELDTLYIESSMSILGERVQNPVYEYRQAQVNSILVEPLIIQESSFNHIGVGLFNKFAQVFLDMHKKRVILMKQR